MNSAQFNKRDFLKGGVAFGLSTLLGCGGGGGSGGSGPPSGGGGGGGGPPKATRLSYIKIVDSSFRTEIFASNPDGSDEKQITQFGDRRILRANWSPDGTRIVYDVLATVVPNTNPNGVAIHVVNADGSGDTQVALGALATWSADGSSIVFSRREREASVSLQLLRSVNPDGSDESVLLKFCTQSGLTGCSISVGDFGFAFDRPLLVLPTSGDILFSRQDDFRATGQPAQTNNLLGILSTSGITNYVRTSSIAFSAIATSDETIYYQDDSGLRVLERKDVSAVGPIVVGEAQPAVSPGRKIAGSDPNVHYRFSPDGAKVAASVETRILTYDVDPTNPSVFINPVYTSNLAALGGMVLIGWINVA
jgi:WD40-like Beta Propeller Repeat